MEKLAQEVTAVLSIYVKNITEERNKGNGNYRVIRYAQKTTWGSVQLPSEIYPRGLQKGDFLVIDGSLSTMKGEIYVFAKTVRQHVSASSLTATHQAANNETKQVTTNQSSKHGSNSKPAGQYKPEGRRPPIAKWNNVAKQATPNQLSKNRNSAKPAGPYKPEGRRPSITKWNDVAPPDTDTKDLSTTMQEEEFDCGGYE